MQRWIEKNWQCIPWVKNKPKTTNGGQKKTVFGGPRVRRSRKALRKGKNKLSEGDSRTFHQEKG